MRLTFMGVTFIVLAFIAPYIASLLGFGPTSASQAGEAAGRTLGSLLVLALLAWATTRGRSDTAKASARVVVGVLLCVLAGSNIAQTASDMQEAKAFVAEAVKFRDEHAAKFAELGRRFDSIDLTKVLTPDALTDSAARAAARATLASYRVLLAERRMQLQAYFLAYARFVDERAPTGDARAGALEGFNEKKRQTEALYSSLDESQTGLVDAMQRVLDWSASQPSLQQRNGQLMFADTRQQAELSALVAQVNEAEKKMNASAQNAQVAQQNAQRDMVDQNRRVQELLGK
jgi:hypothetical protein